MVKKRKKLLSIIACLSIILLLIFSAFSLITQLFVYQREYVSRSDKMKQDYLASQKAMLKTEIDQLIRRFEYQESLVSLETEKLLKDRVYEVYNLLSGLYNRDRDNHSTEEILSLMTESLKIIEQNDGQGYFFIMNMSGITLFNGADRELENRDPEEILDLYGLRIDRELVSLMEKNKEAFYRYNWYKPGDSGSRTNKISFIKKFEPLDIFIGTGIYEDDVREQLQNRIIDSLEYVYRQRPEFLFAGTWEGDSLFGPAKGKNMWEIQDINGLKVVQELVKTAKEGEGFIEYVMPHVSRNENRHKISYVRGIKKWGWYVGAGVYLDDIEVQTEELRLELAEDIKQGVIITVLLTLVMVLVLLLIINLLNRYIKDDFSYFIHFFKEVLLNDSPIVTEDIRFAELYEMAGYANRMLENKILIQKDLINEKELLTITLQSIDNGVITLDENKKIILMNRMAEELTQWELNQAKGQDLSNVYIKKTLPRQAIMNKEGHIIDIEESFNPIEDSRGNIRGYVLVFRDISEKLRREEERQKNRNLESVGYLAGGIAHNFNNILTGLFGNIELALAEMEESAQYRKYLEISLEAMNQAKDLTSRLLTFAKGGKPHLKKIEITPLVKKIIPKGISCRFNSGEGIYPIMGDEKQLILLFENLVQNALEAMESEMELGVEIKNIQLDNYSKDSLTGSYVQIIFTDRGKGIAEENLPHIFDPYFTTKLTGNGLGLTTAYSIISNHGGLIEVNSEQGNGTSIVIHLPAQEK